MPKPDILLNQCAKAGHFYACDQSVNGGAGSLLVFIPRGDKPGMYYTQNIRPEGRATSRADLEINGNVWTFLSNWDTSGHTIYYRTINTFEGHTKIKYEQAESSNGKDWKVTDSGQETKSVSQVKYVALLRGVNVGGNNKLPMKNLAAIFAASGCENISNLYSKRQRRVQRECKSHSKARIQHLRVD